MTSLHMSLQAALAMARAEAPVTSVPRHQRSRLRRVTLRGLLLGGLGVALLPVSTSAQSTPSAPTASVTIVADSSPVLVRLQDAARRATHMADRLGNDVSLVPNAEQASYVAEFATILNVVRAAPDTTAPAGVDAAAWREAWVALAAASDRLDFHEDAFDLAVSVRDQIKRLHIFLPLHAPKEAPPTWDAVGDDTSGATAHVSPPPKRTKPKPKPKPRKP